MPDAVMVASAEGHTGKSAIAVGLLEALVARTARVGVFRPVSRSATGDADYVLELLLSRATADVAPAEAVGTTYEQVHHDPEAALAVILARYGAIAPRCDAVVVLGSDYTDVGTPTELSFNARVAANLAAPVLLVVSGRRAEGAGARSAAEIAQVAEIAASEFRSEHAALAGVVVNRADPARLPDVGAAVRAQVPADVPVSTVPEDPALVAPTLATVLEAADAQVIAGDPAQAERDVRGIVVAAMTLENLLPRLTEGSLVVMPGDRTDTLVGVLLAHQSGLPPLTGVLLTGGIGISPNVARLVAGLGSGLPIAITDLGTFDTVSAVAAARGLLAAESPQKTARAVALFDAHVDVDALLDSLGVRRSGIVTPLMFEYGLLTRAQRDVKHIVLPEGDDERVIAAAGIVLARGVAQLTILGAPDEVRARAAAQGFDLTGAHLVDPLTDPLRERFADVYFAARQHRGMTRERAADTVVDPSYFGTLMVHLGLADGMVSGARHTTAATIRPAFELIRTAPGVEVVSSVFLMALADRVLVYGDCAVIPDPTAEQLADVAISAAGTAQAFGIEPRVAMLSYSTGSSGTGADVEKVRAATALVRERAPQLAVEGPIQYDAAADPDVAAAKLPGSPVAGRATVFVFPDLNTGNNTYKAVQRSSNALAIGPVLQGLAKPVNDLSRGALVRDIVNTIAITAIQAAVEEPS